MGVEGKSLREGFVSADEILVGLAQPERMTASLDHCFFNASRTFVASCWIEKGF